MAYCEKCGKYSGKWNLCKECYYEETDEQQNEEKALIKPNEEKTEDLICPICGEPTSVWYGNPRKDKLCRAHATQLKNGEIFIDGHNRFRDKNSNTILDKNQNKNTRNKIKKEEPEIEIKSNENEKNVVQDTNNVIVINENNRSKCITCGRKTDGLLFCSECYKKYSKKELLFKITECSQVELLDEDYEGRYTCKDGHIVKSKSERDIDNYLFEHGIPHAYEKELAYGATEKEVLHPDFYLPNYLGKNSDVYIEHWGYNENNLHYTKTKKFKIPKYEELKITLICTYEKTDMGKIDAVLDRKLNPKFIKENKINYEE